MAAYTGLRRGELIALRWRDVRWSERVLVVERALSGTVERTTKGRRIRYVEKRKSRDVRPARVVRALGPASGGYIAVARIE